MYFAFKERREELERREKEEEEREKEETRREEEFSKVREFFFYKFIHIFKLTFNTTIRKSMCVIFPLVW